MYLVVKVGVTKVITTDKSTARQIDEKERNRDPNSQIRLAVDYTTHILYIKKICEQFPSSCHLTIYQIMCLSLPSLSSFWLIFLISLKNILALPLIYIRQSPNNIKPFNPSFMAIKRHLSISKTRMKEENGSTHAYILL